MAAISAVSVAVPVAKAQARRSVAAAAVPEQSRRAAISTLAAGAAALTLEAKPANAAYGEAANVFGKATNTTGFVPYTGDGFAILLPSKWVPSKEQDFINQGLETALRYEDNFDAVNTLMVLKQKAAGGDVGAYGNVEEFLKKFGFILGTQSFSGDTISEGGFGRGRVASASVLSLGESTDKKGRKQYRYEILNRTADGNEGGRHQLITGVVSDGNLYILKIQAGDKRWFKGVRAEAEGSWNSFTVV